MERRTATFAIVGLLLIIAALAGLLLGRVTSPAAPAPAPFPTHAAATTGPGYVPHAQPSHVATPTVDAAGDEGDYLFHSGPFNYTLHKCVGSKPDAFCDRIKSERGGTSGNYISDDFGDITAYSYYSSSESNDRGDGEGEGFIPSPCTRGNYLEVAFISLKAMGVKDKASVSCGDGSYEAFEDDRFYYFSSNMKNNDPLQ